jgi:hypothetical protein
MWKTSHCQLAKQTQQTPKNSLEQNYKKNSFSHSMDFKGTQTSSLEQSRIKCKESHKSSTFRSTSCFSNQ